ncbi:hypothetical protein [Turicibacter bilis]|uniref:hypothetical protein n=1 Tax=Turicibacter bilis TaxID=2735723 RepID=UPI001BB0BDA0|nr:hypothetical protein [Turicibacter bilis]MBS3198954.1 hypothetical protein [Turicibacter bilis]
MKITEITKINQNIINYINSKTSNGYSISNIIREEIGENTPKKEIEKKRKYISKKISSAGYRFNIDKKIYELYSDNTNNDQNKINKEIKKYEKEITKDEVKIKEINDNKETKIKRKYIKKKDKEIEEKIKENPLFFEFDLLPIMSNIDTIYHEIQSNPKRIGIRLNKNIVDLFKIIEQRYGYIDSYLLINNAIYSCFRHIEKLKDSSWLIEYSNFIAQNTTTTKKQINLSSCKMIDQQINLFEANFPILDRSKVVDFSLYIYSQCYLNKINSSQE